MAIASLTPTQDQIIEYLQKHGKTSSQDLRNLIGISARGLNKAIKPLVENQLINRSTDKHKPYFEAKETEKSDPQENEKSGLPALFSSTESSVSAKAVEEHPLDDSLQQPPLEIEGIEVEEPAGIDLSEPEPSETLVDSLMTSIIENNMPILTADEIEQYVRKEFQRRGPKLRSIKTLHSFIKKGHWNLFSAIAQVSNALFQEKIRQGEKT